MEMATNMSVIFLALLIVAMVPLNWWHNRFIAKQVAKALDAAAQLQNRRFDEIYKLADGRLSESLQTIEDLKALLLELEPLDAEDPRIKRAIAKNS